MLLIPCPHCGERDESEFCYGGRALKYPVLDHSGSREDWHQCLHQRSPQRIIHEYWYHQFGCECWFEVSRDTLTHEINALADCAPASPIEKA